MKTKDERLEFKYYHNLGLIEIYDSVVSRSVSLTPDEIRELCRYVEELIIENGKDNP